MMRGKVINKTLDFRYSPKLPFSKGDLKTPFSRGEVGIEATMS